MHFNTIHADLTEQGWSIQDNFLTPELCQQLQKECRQHYAQGLFREAGVGRGRGRHASVQHAIRADQLRWLEDGMSDCTDLYLAEMNTLRQQLNEQLFLGLTECENHFAVYEPGAFYKKHLDQFRDNNSRVISSVFYLNPDWKPAHRGELRLHLPDQPLDIAPLANRLVVFSSAEIWHEVLPTEVERLSLTGWFRR